VCIALVVSFDGFSLGYEVFPGNMNDARTVEKIVTSADLQRFEIVEGRRERSRPVVQASGSSLCRP
jgi:hypothetical protein